MEQAYQNSSNINTYIVKHPIGETRAERFRQKLLKNICKSFQPFKQYYNRFQIQYLVKPKPIGEEKCYWEWKNQMTLAKQLEYVRGKTEHYLDEEYLERVLEEDWSDRGLMENHQNRSILLNNKLIIVSGNSLKSIIFQQGEPIEKSTQEYLVYYEFPEMILEIELYEDSVIRVRCRYWLFLFDSQSNEIKIRYRFKQEITACKQYKNNQCCILVCTYDQNDYRLYEWNINDNSANVIKCCSSFFGIHSLIALNPRQFILGFANKIKIQDLRTPTHETLRRVSEMGNDRFVSLGVLEKRVNQVVLAKSKCIDIFQLRKPEHSVASVRHYCEEAPPSCLVSFDWMEPCVIAYSPSYLGSSLLLNITNFQQYPQNQSIYNQNQNQPMLLFDSGKLYRELYPKTISIEVSGNVLKIFHIDNGDGVSLEQFRKEGNSIRRVGGGRGKEYPGAPWRQWIYERVLEPFLARSVRGEANKEEDLQLQQQETSQILSVKQKKINYCTFDKFKKKIEEVAKVGTENKKGNQFVDTYFSESLNIQPQENPIEIVNNGREKNISEESVNQELLDFLDKEWKI